MRYRAEPLGQGEVPILARDKQESFLLVVDAS